MQQYPNVGNNKATVAIWPVCTFLFAMWAQEAKLRRIFSLSETF